jgi:hypothetical protein
MLSLVFPFYWQQEVDASKLTGKWEGTVYAELIVGTEN